MKVSERYADVIFPEGIVPLQDFGTVVMAQSKSAEQALNGKPVGSSISWGDGWCWMVLSVANEMTTILPVRREAKSEA